MRFRAQVRFHECVRIAFRLVVSHDLAVFEHRESLARQRDDVLGIDRAMPYSGELDRVDNLIFPLGLGDLIPLAHCLRLRECKLL